VPPGVIGTVINAKVFSRKGVDKDERAQQIEDEEEARLLKDQNDEIRILKESALGKVRKILSGNVCVNKLVDDKGRVILKKGDELNEEALKDLPERMLTELPISDGSVLERVKRHLDSVKDQIEMVTMAFGEKIQRLKKGDELPPGVIKMVKVYLAVKRKLSVGDKMAGRHGNKGVISRVLPEADMPYLEDGTPVDLVLNPLGVPSRMNVGQILETHLGWALLSMGETVRRMVDVKAPVEAIRKELRKVFDDVKLGGFLDGLSDTDLLKVARRVGNGIKVSTPVFDGASEDAIRKLLAAAGLPINGQAILYDGRSGEAFDQDVTVGVMYMLKLHHLVDDKIHARSIGPYSLVTQQPLGGKAQFGGQRLGEMEVWAMEAYGAAFSLQEFLTVKSDDVVGRTRMYEAIVKGEHVLESGVPESFNVLIKELQSLALDVSLMEEDESGAIQ
jgi:DNA-directed RNA polymerase subunit beta